MAGIASLTVNYPYLMGAYLGLNAIPDLYLFMDGPDCVAFKAEYIQGRHDLNSTLISCSGENRIFHPEVDVTSIVHDRTRDIENMLHEMEKIPELKGILYTSMPMATITGTQYDSIINSMDPPLSKPLFHVPPLSLTRDWLDGYAAVMKSLAAGLELKGTPDPKKVAVIGYFMDRNENDHLANIKEIETMIRALGHEPSSIWLSGRPLEHLALAGEVGVIISLPHGREAAATLAERTGAKLLEIGLPIGLEGTVNWVRQVGDFLEAREKAEAYIRGGLSSVIPSIKWLVGKIFQGRSLFFCGDPHYMDGFYGFFRELGCEVEAMAAVSREHHLSPLPARMVSGGVNVGFDMEPEALSKFSMETSGGSGPDIIISGDDGLNYLGRSAKAPARIPFGFPNHTAHAVFDSPFMGFHGAAWLADRVANAVMTALSEQHSHR